MNVSTNKETNELRVERVFNAGRELVFKAWTEAERLQQWFGPKGWTLPVCEIDLRPGGVWRYCMRGPGGEESWGRTVYHEVRPPERLVYTDSFADADGNVVENMPEMLITVDFIEEDGKTRIASTTRFASAEALESILSMGVIQGFTETLDRLDEYLARHG
jgi:uncharacterized protein YndB with AHSA1/START domain